jgi:outer membrane receptor protein involved in Fe transport
LTLLPISSKLSQNVARSARVVLVVSAILGSPRPVHAQQVVTGSVTEQGSRLPLSGAHVSIGRSGDTTRANGSFRVIADQAAQLKLRVTKLGFLPVERIVRTSGPGAVVVNVELRRTAIGLDAVVVTGSAGATQVREVGHSVAEIRPASYGEPISSVDQLLTARIPGLMVIPATGMAGGGSKIRLRESSSVALSNQPLVYVDGVRIRSDAYPKNSPFNDRSRGPNDTPSPVDDIDPLDIDRIEVVRGPAATTLYGTEAAAGVIQIFTKRGTSGRTQWTSQADAGVSSVRPFGPTDEPYMRIDPWLRDATRAGYGLSLSGGSDVRYHLSTSYHRNEGVLPNDLEKRRSIRGNFDLSPAKNLTLAWSSSVSLDDLRNTPAGPNAQGLTQNAYRGPANATGVEGKESLDRILAWDITTKLNHAIGGLTAVWTPSAATSHSFTFGYDRAESEMRSLRPFGFVFAPQGILSAERWLSTTATADYLGKWRIPLRTGNSLVAAWGGQSIRTSISSNAGYGEGFAGTSAPTLSSAATTLAAESRTNAVIAGGFAQGTLELQNRLFLTAGLRIDGSSSFGSDFGLQPFPRVSASYVISDESFWPARLGTFRLRAAYGQAGRAPRVFDADRTWIQTNYDGKPAYLPSSIGNSNLGPERSGETEVGFDAGSRDDRFHVQATFFNRVTRDALLPVTQPPSLGFLAPQLTNAATIKIRGAEVSVDRAFDLGRAFSLDAGVDVALNHSKVTSLGGAPAFILTEVAWIKQGYAAPVLIGPKLKNPDAIADPIIENDHVFGPNMPTRTIGLHSELEIPHGARLSVRIEYQGGNYLYDNASGSLFRQSVHPLCYSAAKNMAAGHPEVLNAWERLWCNQSNLPANGPIERGDFARLRDASVTLPLRGSWIRARSANLTFAAGNFTIWKNKDLRVFDPEMGGRDGLDAPVRFIELAVPRPATLSVAVRATYW